MKFITLLIIALSAQLAHAGSWSSGGGGTGIACFDSEEAAISVRSGADFASHPELVRSMISVLMTDYAENANDRFVEPLEGETPNDYLERVVDSRLQYAPAFFRVLRSALEKVQISTVPTTNNLQASNDTGGLHSWATSRTNGDRTSTTLHIDPNCVVVQVALRTTTTGSGGKTNVRVAVNETLYSHLGDGSSRSRVINQAVLILHEALYLVASSQGQKTSLNTRVLTATLLAENRIDFFKGNARWIRKVDPQSVNPEGMAMQQELSVDGFSTALAPTGNRPAGSLSEALKSYQAKQQKIQAALNGIEAGTDEERKLVDRMYDSLSGPEAVVFLSSLALQRGRISDISSVVDSSAPDHKASLQAVCELAKNLTVGTAATADGPADPNEANRVRSVRSMIARAAQTCATAKLR